MIYNETWNMVKIYINNLFEKIKSLGLLYMYLFLNFKIEYIMEESYV